MKLGDKGKQGAAPPPPHRTPFPHLHPLWFCLMRVRVPRLSLPFAALVSTMSKLQTRPAGHADAARTAQPRATHSHKKVTNQGTTKLPHHTPSAPLSRRPATARNTATKPRKLLPLLLAYGVGCARAVRWVLRTEGD
jgi:hypothetical protein